MKKALEKKLDVAEMRVLRWVMRKTRGNGIQNDKIREMAGVMEAQERRLHWNERALRRHESHVVKRMLELQVEDKRPQRKTEEAVKELDR